MRIAAIQLEIGNDSPEERFDRALESVREEAARGVDVVMLPEMWVPGYFGFERYEALAEPLDGPMAKGLAQVAAEARIVLHAGSMVERSERGLYNTSVMFDADGNTLATYRKVHLFPYGSQEHDVLTRGSDVVVVDVAGTKVGLSTCYDFRFPELYRAMVDRGAELFLAVAGWPFPRIDAWRILGRARAIENQAALVACNSAGRQGAATFLGASYAVNAWGTVLGELDDRPGVLRCEIDVDAVRAARQEFPALAGRVLEVGG